MKTALTIAGSDSSGGAGIQADIKTMTVNGVYAMSAICALTAQNTIGVSDIYEVSPDFLQKQLDAVFEDIFPDAVKIGMVSTSDLIDVIAQALIRYGAKNIVTDPVMISTSGSRLLREDAITALRNKLFPISSLITPNIPEAEILSGITIRNKNDMLTVAKKLFADFSVPVLLKGGHLAHDACDLLYLRDAAIWLDGAKIDNPNTHGTGCTLSSAIAANLAKGFDLISAVKKGKEFVSDALSAMLNLGRGSGPLNHAFDLRGKYTKEAF